MTYRTGMRSAVCIAALVVGGAAQADVTADQVWQDWKNQLAMNGENTLSVGSEDMDGDTLTVSDIAVMVDDEMTKVEVALGDLVFAEQGDGTVQVTLPESYPVKITAEDGAVITIDISQTGAEMVVSGNPDAMTYDVTADTYAVSLVDVVNGDITFTGDVKATANNVTGSYTSEMGDIRRMAYDLGIASVDLLVDIKVPGEDGGYVTASGKVEGVQGQFEMNMPEDASFDDPESLFGNGFGMTGGYTVDSGAYVVDMDAEGERFNGSANFGAGRLDMTMDETVMAYNAQTEDLAVNMTVPNFPLPIELTLAQYGVGFKMPLAQSEEPEDFGLSLDLVDLTINDALWDLFDAGQVLPRDPATIQLDLSGTATPNVNLMDPEAVMMAGSDMPVALNTLSLNDLRIALAGALITGSGEFTFDNTDLTTFEGMPRPEGSALIEMVGLNGLMDNLVTMGLVPQDQIMGGRMMLGMFARVTGDDELETKLEINGEGHVSVNGQRIR